MSDETEKQKTEIVRHCPTCICGRRAPVQGESRPHERAPGTVTWAEHEEAYTGYAARFGTSQSAERLAQRGGFGYREMTEFLGHEPTTWVARGVRPLIEKIGRDCPPASPLLERHSNDERSSSPDGTKSVTKRQGDAGCLPRCSALA